MNPIRRTLLIAAGSAIAGVSAAQGFPSRPVTIVVPFAPGGSSDATARAISVKLAALLGQSVVLDNRPGANGTIGAGIDLMYDGGCDLKTFADALYVGKACDDAGFFWYEDPYRDTGVSAFSHRKLREMISTPLLIGEHVRGLEPKADFILSGGTDFVRVDPEYDMGITGAIKTARLAEAFGLDVEVHAVGPAHRHVMGAVRNSNYYEVALVGPDCPNVVPPVYACGYTDQIDCIDRDGTVGVPEGPGLGVRYDWAFIDRHATARHVFELKRS